MPQIALVPTFTIREGRMNAFLERVKRQRDDCLALEPACRHFDVLVHPDRPNTVMLYEIYDDAEAVARHRSLPHYKDFRAAIADLVEAIDVAEWTIA